MFRLTELKWTDYGEMCIKLSTRRKEKKKFKRNDTQPIFSLYATFFSPILILFISNYFSLTKNEMLDCFNNISESTFILKIFKMFNIFSSFVLSPPLTCCGLRFSVWSFRFLFCSITVALHYLLWIYLVMAHFFIILENI